MIKNDSLKYRLCRVTKSLPKSIFSPGRHIRGFINAHANAAWHCEPQKENPETEVSGFLVLLREFESRTP